MFRVTREIHFCYGHRLLNYAGKCRHLHGHNGMVEVDIESTQLNELGMVVDFGDINEVVKEWINANLDHKMLLNRADPLAGALIAAGEPIFFMDENPTAENIARLIWLAAHQAGMQVGEVRVWETSTSRASYSGAPWTE